MKWLPFSDDSDVRDHAKQLGLDDWNIWKFILFAILVAASKWFESGVSVVAEEYPVIIYGVDISLFFWWGVIVVVATPIFLYGKPAVEVADETSEEVAEASGEVVDSIKEKIEEE